MLQIGTRPTVCTNIIRKRLHVCVQNTHTRTHTQEIIFVCIRVCVCVCMCGRASINTIQYTSTDRINKVYALMHHTDCESHAHRTNDWVWNVFAANSGAQTHTYSDHANPFSIWIECLSDIAYLIRLNADQLNWLLLHQRQQRQQQ